MGYKRTRPYVGRTPDGVAETYIVIEADERPTHVQVIANGTVTFTVDYTNQNILYSTAAQAAVNVGGQTPPEQDRYVDPSSATWVNLIASGSVSADASLDVPAFAIRINVTAGTGSVSWHITQS